MLQRGIFQISTNTWSPKRTSCLGKGLPFTDAGTNSSESTAHLPFRRAGPLFVFHFDKAGLFPCVTYTVYLPILNNILEKHLHTTAHIYQHSVLTQCRYIMYNDRIGNQHPIPSNIYQVSALDLSLNELITQPGCKWLKEEMWLRHF